MRFSIRVKPGAKRASVSGRYGQGEQARLVVAVGARAVDGKATEAALEAVGQAFGVPRRAVSLVTGATSRDKVVQIEGDDDALRARLAQLLAL